MCNSGRILEDKGVIKKKNMKMEKKHEHTREDLSLRGWRWKEVQDEILTRLN